MRLYDGLSTHLGRLGVTYSLSWTAFAKYIYEAAPPGTEGTMMGLLNSMNGVGRGIGILFGGYLYEDFGVRVLWCVADLGVPLALVGLYVFSKSLPSSESRLEVVRLIPPKEIDP